MRARYADGRIALFRDADCAFTADGVLIQLGGVSTIWRYNELARSDDDNGRVALKRKPDTGERLMLDAEAAAALRGAAPGLFSAQARGIESPAVTGGLIAAAWSLAAAFLIGVPLAAGPIADALPPRLRERVADISWSQVEAVTNVCHDSDEAARVLNGAAYRLMSAADVAHKDNIWITIVDAPFPNAFALPDDSIIVTDDLIALAEGPDEVVGVIAHEIAHIERNHVMKNIIRNVGAGVFFDIVFGGAGAGQAIAIASVNLAGLRYSRGDEAEADARGIQYLEAARIDPGALARLFDRLEAQQQGELPTILSSHPATGGRAAAARAHAHPGQPPALGPREWRIVQHACGAQPPPLAPPEPAVAPEPAAPAKPGAAPELEGGGKSLRDRTPSLPSAGATG